MGVLGQAGSTIRVGWQIRGDRGSLPRFWLNDPWYPEFPTPISIALGSRIQVSIACCADITGKTVSGVDGAGADYWAEWYLNEAEANPIWRFIGPFPNSLMGGSTSARVFQEVEISALGAPEIGSITFYNTTLRYYSLSVSPCRDSAADWASWGGWVPTSETKTPADSPYSQHWVSPWNLGYVYKP